MLTLCVGCLFCCMSATLTHMVPRVSDLGLHRAPGGANLVLRGRGGGFGKVLFGYLVDRVDPRVALYTAIGTQFLGQLGMLQTTDYPLFALFATLFGFGMGGIVPLHGHCGAGVWARDFGKVMNHAPGHDAPANYRLTLCWVGI